jgi:hypothetical protein
MKNVLIAALALFLLAGCISANKSMREATTKVNMQKSDFQITDKQVTGYAKQIKVLGIDWARLFKKEKGSIYIQIIGHNERLNKVERYALFDLLKQFPGYDVMFYPTFDYRKVNVLWIYQKTEVTAGARLGKLKNN